MKNLLLLVACAPLSQIQGSSCFKGKSSRSWLSDAKELPSAIDLPLGDVVAKERSGQIGDLEQLRQAVVSALSDEAIPEEEIAGELATS
jgi:hypothetical protein